MTKKKSKLQATATQKSSAQDELQKNFEAIVKIGEVLSTEIIGKLAQYGNSFLGIYVETYALCKAYASLKVVAQDADFEIESLFQKLLPYFIDEAKELLEEVKNLENV